MYILGFSLIAVATFWIVINAFRQSVWWVIGILLFPFVALIFALTHFGENKIPLLLYVAATVLFVIAAGDARADYAMLAEM